MNRKSLMLALLFCGMANFVCCQGTGKGVKSELSDSFQESQHKTNNEVKDAESKLPDSIPSFNVDFNELNLDGGVFFETIKSPFHILYYDRDYSAENKNGGMGTIVGIPRDTSVCKIIDENSEKGQERFERRKIILSSLKEPNVENRFDIYLYYAPQEYLTFENYAMTDDGREVPDYYIKDGLPLQVFQYKGGKWVFLFWQERDDEATHMFSRRKATEVICERFGKMVEEMERKQNR